MAEIFTLDHDFNEQNIKRIHSNNNLEQKISFNFQTAQRIEQAKSVLRCHSLLALLSEENNEPITITRTRYLARLNPAWSLESEKIIFETKAHQKEFDIMKTSLTHVTPSNSMLEVFEESRPSSYSSSYSPSSFKSPSRLRFRDQ